MARCRISHMRLIGRGQGNPAGTQSTCMQRHAQRIRMHNAHTRTVHTRIRERERDAYAYTHTYTRGHALRMKLVSFSCSNRAQMACSMLTSRQRTIFLACRFRNQRVARTIPESQQWEDTQDVGWVTIHLTSNAT